GGDGCPGAGPRGPDRAPHGDASAPPPLGAADRGARLPEAVVARPVPLRARPAGHPLLPRGPGRAERGRLRRPAAGGRRRPRHHRGRGPGLAPPRDRHPDAAGAGPDGGAARLHEPDARGAGRERRRAGPVPSVRLRARRHPEGLLPGDQRGRDRHVGTRCGPARLRPAPRRHRGCAAGSHRGGGGAV
ncbi:MAG: Ribosomal-protein-S18p-alanine acetyltransferase, partial [uncultured Acidimicrobiales bacterium]